METQKGCLRKRSSGRKRKEKRVARVKRTKIKERVEKAKSQEIIGE